MFSLISRTTNPVTAHGTEVARRQLYTLRPSCDNVSARKALRLRGKELPPMSSARRETVPRNSFAVMHLATPHAFGVQAPTSPIVHVATATIVRVYAYTGRSTAMPCSKTHALVFRQTSG